MKTKVGIKIHHAAASKQDGRAVKRPAERAGEFLSSLAARSRDLWPKERAQDGRAVKRPAERAGEFLSSLAARSRDLCALLCGLILLFPAPAKCQKAGNFDYYLLALSWSPEFCYSHRDSPECGKHLGLIVHGLWPQYSNSPSGPEHCGNQPGLANPASMLDIMPDPHLIQHEWTTHGTCSGMSANDYFGMIRRLYNSIHVPSDLQQPRRQFIIRSAALKQEFERANPGLNDAEMALGCTGPYLNAVEFCFTKEGKPMACRAVRDCKAPSLRVPAVR